MISGTEMAWQMASARVWLVKKGELTVTMQHAGRRHLYQERGRREE